MTKRDHSKGLALVTGASSGIGEAYARRLAKDGFDLLLVARRAERLETLGEELSKAHQVHATPLAADLATTAGINALERAIIHGPPLAWLVCSAGFGTRGQLVDLPPDTITAMVRLHVEANARLVRAALPGMLAERRGQVVLVSSLSAFLTTAEYVSYSATKAFINMFARGLADELTGTGVRVQALCPGLTRTEFFETEAFRHFKYDAVPSWAWMSTEQVVDESVGAMGRHLATPIFVPGRGNRAFLALMETPLVGTATRAALARLGRGRKLF